MKKTQTLLQLLLVGVLAFGATSCSSESFLDGFFDQFSLQGTNETMAEIAGDWTATVANFSRAAAGPVLEVDIIAMGGTASLMIQQSGRFTFTWQLPGEAAVVTTGQMAFDQDILVVAEDSNPGDWEFFGIMFMMSDMQLNGPAEYDFDGDDIADALDNCLDALRRPNKTLEELRLADNRGSAKPIDWSRYAFDRDFLRAIPRTPGTYRFFDREENLLYVGKSKNLHQRIGSYFRRGGPSCRSRRDYRVRGQRLRAGGDPARSGADPTRQAEEEHPAPCP